MEQVNRAKEAPDFLIDQENGALINTNNRALQGYRAQRQQMRKVQSGAARLDALEAQMNRIEQLLIKVLDK
jgi:hypothetical protein